MIHDEIADVLKRRVVGAGAAPGGSAFVAAHRGGAWRTGSGSHGQYSKEDLRSPSADTVYDLASLTKPVVACAAARLVRRGELDWSLPLGRVLAAARGSASEGTPLELLASHRAGLEAHVLLPELPGSGGREAWWRHSANARRVECGAGVPGPEGFEPVYSDLGYILLGAALEAVAGIELDVLIEREVSAACGFELGSARQWAARLGAEAFAQRVAPTEVLPSRGGQLRGVVHDDNAWALAGHGAAGHAGLFGTARAVGQLGMAVLDALSGRDPGWLRESDVERLVRPRPGGSLRAGFDGKAAQGSSAGPRLGPRSFGHLGFTGTSFWCDPDAQIVVVLLTNRVCPTRENILLRAVRPDVHGELFGLAADL